MCVQMCWHVLTDLFYPIGLSAVVSSQIFLPFPFQVAAAFDKQHCWVWYHTYKQLSEFSWSWYASDPIVHVPTVIISIEAWLLTTKVTAFNILGSIMTYYKVMFWSLVHCAGYLYNFQTKELYDLSYGHEPQGPTRFGGLYS